MTTNFYPADSFKLFVTEAPFELENFVKTVEEDSYVDCGVDENFAYYIAQSTPSWNVENNFDFEIASVGDTYEDDYTSVEVMPEGIYFTNK